MAADVAQAAGGALGASGDADGAAMVYKAVTEVIALFRRDDLPEFALYLCRLFDVVDEADQVAETDAVGVGDDGRLAEDIAHDKVCALAADAGQGQELFEGLRHMVVVLLVQDAHAGADVAGLAAAQAAGADDLFNFLRFRGSQCRHVRVFFVQQRCDLVYTGVGALGGQADAHQELPGLFIVQRALRDRVLCFQPLNYLQGEFFPAFFLFCEGGLFSCFCFYWHFCLRCERALRHIPI